LDDVLIRDQRAVQLVEVFQITWVLVFLVSYLVEQVSFSFLMRAGFRLSSQGFRGILERDDGYGNVSNRVGLAGLERLVDSIMTLLVHYRVVRVVSLMEVV